MSQSPDLIKEHYKKEAEIHKDAPVSTMADVIIRDKELELIQNFFKLLVAPANVLEIGCGNGFTLEMLLREFPKNKYTGLDYTEELLDQAKARGLGCELHAGDSRALPFGEGQFDIVYTERCLINVLEDEGKLKSIDEIHRVLKPGGLYLMMEGFEDGMENNNRARQELGLETLSPAHHNTYFNKKTLYPHIEGKLERIEPETLSPVGLKIQWNFLSSHYFFARVLHPLITKGEQTRNTEMVKFFAHMPPMGNYSPLQAHIFRKL